MPVEEEEEVEAAAPSAPGGPSHTEIEYRLPDPGSKMGLKMWAPKNDRGGSWNGSAVGQVPRLLDELPTNFDDITNGIVENIPAPNPPGAATPTRAQCRCPYGPASRGSGALRTPRPGSVSLGSFRTVIPLGGPVPQAAQRPLQRVQ